MTSTVVGSRFDQAMLLFVVADGGTQALDRQHGAVRLDRRQPAQLVRGLLPGDLLGLVQGLAFGHLGDYRAGGDVRGAAVGFELDVFDDLGLVVHLDVYRHHVPAGGAALGGLAVRVLHLAYVARVPEMLQHRVVVREGHVTSLLLVIRHQRADRPQLSDHFGDGVHHAIDVLDCVLYRPKVKRTEPCARS